MARFVVACGKLRDHLLGERWRYIFDCRLEIRMVDRKELPALRIVIGCTLAAYVAGEQLEFSKAPANQMIAIATASSTTANVVATFNPMTFSKIEPPPPIVPPGDRQQQG